MRQIMKILHKQLLMTRKELCSNYHIQMCHDCLEFSCCDNIAKRELNIPRITLEDEDTDNPKLMLNGTVIATVYNYYGSYYYSYYDFSHTIIKQLYVGKAKPEAVDWMLAEFGLTRGDL